MNTLSPKEQTLWKAIHAKTTVNINGNLFDPYVVVILREDSRKRFVVGRLHTLNAKEAFLIDIDDIKVLEDTSDSFESELKYAVYNEKKFYHG